MELDFFDNNKNTFHSFDDYSPQNELFRLVSSHYLLRSISFRNQAEAILVHGSSSSGKTYTVNTVLKQLNIPYINIDIKQYSEVGYQGKNVDNMLQEFAKSLAYDKEKIYSGAIVIDEFDKIKSDNNSHELGNRDVSGLGVQSSLLKILDGIEVTIPTGNSMRSVRDIKIDTSKILYIFIGAFAWIPNDANSPQFLKLIKEHGFLPELINRLSSTIYIKNPSIEDLTSEFSNLLNKITTLFKSQNISVTFDLTNKTINNIATEIMLHNNGYRGLSNLIENIVLEILRTLQSSSTHKILITDDHVKNSLKYLLG